MVTDVGDARHIVGDTGFVVPPKHPAKLAEGILNVHQRDANGNKNTLSGRKRIIQLFGLRSTVEQYEELYERTLAGRSPANPERRPCPRG